MRPAAPHATATLPAKTCGYLNNKLHPLFLDTDLNGAATVARNIFQMAAFAAFKLHCLLRSSPEGASARVVCAAVDEAATYVADSGPRTATASAAARQEGGRFDIPRCVPARVVNFVDTVACFINYLLWAERR